MSAGANKVTEKDGTTRTKERGTEELEEPEIPVRWNEVDLPQLADLG